MARILCTGGAGFIGSVLVPALLDAGHRVTVLDNFMWRQNSLAHVCHDPNLEIVRGDVRDNLLMPGLLDDADMVIPLAALVGAPLCDLDVDGAISTNSKAISWLCDNTDLPIIVPISNSGYGIGEPDKECTEDSPLRPISLYGRTKVQAEEAVLERGNAISLRLATVFGMSPRMRVDLLVNQFVYQAVTERALVLFEAHFRRNFINVRDVARAFLHAIDNFDAMKDRPYNVGLSDANLTKRQLCERIKLRVPEFTFMEAETGKDVDQRDYLVSNARLEATGFKPSYSLDDGIVELIKGYAMLRNMRYGNV
jgi:nucleoside-diphosphate-sugar epimerase